VYVPYQIAVHAKLEQLGYTVAYGRGDDSEDMKTSQFGGCTDWIYCRGVASRRDEKVVITGMTEKGGATDHNGVIVTLILSWQAHEKRLSGKGTLCEPCCTG